MQRTLIATTLVALGAAVPEPAQTTINVEIDFMSTAGCDHCPTQAEIDAVVAMFACQGITLNVVVSNAVPHTTVVECPNPGVDGFFTCAGPDSFASIRNTHKDFPTSWHYCVFGHFYDDGDGTDSSGLAELPGNDLFVADGLFGTCPNVQPFWRAATFAHELGHNLGLQHVAPTSSGGNLGPYAPNLPSVMSYRYQLGGVKRRLESYGLVGNDHRFKELDFSSGRLPTLAESSLEEAVGLGIRQVDWDCGGAIGGTVNRNLDVAADWCSAGVDSDILRDHDEWVQILSQPAPIVTDDSIPVPYVTCPGPDVAESAGCPSGPILTTESCASGAMIWVDPNANPLFQTGAGSRPYVNVDTAVGNAPAGSVLYLQPGAQSFSAGGAYVIDQPLVLAGPGGAVLDP